MNTFCTFFALTTRVFVEIISELLDPLEEVDSFTDVSEQLLACLRITKELLKYSHREMRNPGILGLLDRVILPGVQNANRDVRSIAMRCLGLYLLIHSVG